MTGTDTRASSPIERVVLPSLTRLTAAAVAGCMLAVAPRSAAAQLLRPTNGQSTYSSATATLTGAVHGPLPSASCGVSPTGANHAVGLTGIQETTPSSAPTASGTFEITLFSTCIAPFYQALFSQEAITSTLTLGGGAQTLTLSLANARLTHVDVDITSVLPGGLMRVTVGVASPQVTVAGQPSAPTTAQPATKSAPAPVRAAGVAQSGAATRKISGNVALASAARLRLPTMQLANPMQPVLPASLGQSWATNGVGTMNIHLVSSSPALDVTASMIKPTLRVHAAVDAITGMPSPSFQIAYDFTIAQPQPLAALMARPALTQAVATYSGYTTHTVGITLWLKSARIATASLSAANGTISVAASQLAITDIGSGRTASLP